MSKKYNIAILGATGVVGQSIISILEERKFPVAKLYPLASSQSNDKKITFHNKSIEVLDAAKFDFSKVKIAFFSAGAEISKIYAKLAAKSGCIVIDNTSLFRNDDEIPLIIPEVNPEKIADYKNKNIISNPNCSTIQMLVVLKPIYDLVGINRINVVTYQSVSGTGKNALLELTKQTKLFLEKKENDIKPNVYSKQIAFNILPHIDFFLENGYTKEEMKMILESKKILNDQNIKINATTARVPVFWGHSEAINIETKEFAEVEKVKEILSNAKGVKLIDDINNDEYPTPIEHGKNTNEVYVGRIRKDLSHSLGINLWVVADNVRKGAGLNSVQIAELLLKYI